MLVKDVPQISRKPLRFESSNLPSDPAYLSAKLRELALRAYRAVRTEGDGTLGNGHARREVVFHAASEHDWTELHGEIVQLERALNGQQLSLLASYVAALRQEVENRLV